MDERNNRVAVAMSGGVDSSVAALLLAREGYTVAGFTAKLHDDAADGRCCSAEAAQRAGRACEIIGIPHVTVDLSRVFTERVIRRYVEEYRAGRTPNPCIDCNRFVKFTEFFRIAEWLDCGFLATGHYVRIGVRPRETFGPVDKRVGDTPQDWRRRADSLFQLLRGVERAKEQSYFVAVITREQLARMMFPCGEYTKQQVRALAEQAGLPTAETPESQDLCFIRPGRGLDYWLQRIAGSGPRPGLIRDLEGSVLGQHAGIERYTRGQRKGLGVGGGPPLYVVDIDAGRGEVIAAAAGSRRATALELTELNLLVPGYTDTSRPVAVQTRYRQREVPATLESTGAGRLTVHLVSPQEHISPGQWCVFYDGEVVVGSGLIDRVRSQ